MATPAHGAHVAMMRDLLATGKYSDFTITCGGDTHRVHKAIVCQRSGFFERAERFPVGKEASEGVVKLPEDDPAIVRLLLQFLYESDYQVESDKSDEALKAAEELRASRMPDGSTFTFDFPHTCTKSCFPSGNPLICPHHRCRAQCRWDCVKFVCDKCALVLEGDKTVQDAPLVHSKMYAIGDKYDVTGLKELARTKFAPRCMALWDDVGFEQVAEHVLTTTPDGDTGLREILCQIIVSHIELLIKPAVADLLKKHTGFAYDVLKHVVEEKAGLKPSA